MDTVVRTCVRCNTADRYKDGKCKVCARTRKAKWAQDHPSYAIEYRQRHKIKLRAYNKAWADANPEAMRAAGRRYITKHAAEHIASTMRWRAANIDRYRSYQSAWWSMNKAARSGYEQNRRSVKVSSGCRIPNSFYANLLNSQKGVCAYCAKPISGGYHIDHIMPFKLGGEHSPNNIQLLCPSCNLRKGAKHPEVFEKERNLK